MNARGLSFLIAALFALQGCTTTVYYAVLAPQTAVDDSKGCVRQCQMLHAGRTNNYLSCLSSCPEAQVIREAQCSEVKYDRANVVCSTAQNQKFEPVVGILAIGTLVLLAVLGLAWLGGFLA